MAGHRFDLDFPILRIAADDFGYDIANYRAIDPTFGKMEDFQALLKKAQQNSCKLVQIVARQITC